QILSSRPAKHLSRTNVETGTVKGALDLATFEPAGGQKREGMGADVVARHDLIAQAIECVAHSFDLDPQHATIVDFALARYFDPTPLGHYPSTLLPPLRFSRPGLWHWRAIRRLSCAA